MKYYPLEQFTTLHGFQIDAYLLALCGWQRGLKLTFHNRRPMDVFFAENTIPNEFPGVVFSLSDGIDTHTFYRTRGDKTSVDAINICADKVAFKQHLLAHSMNTPAGDVFNIKDTDEITCFAAELGYPIVIKPSAGSMGRGVHANIKNEDVLIQAIDDIRSNFPEYRDVIIESYFSGEDYRIYVVDGQVVAAYTRTPAHVIGDEIHTIRELINMKNEARLNNPNTRNKQIMINPSLKQYLESQNHSLDDIPSKDSVIHLTNIPNISMGGEPTDVTGTLSTEIKTAVVEAVKSIEGLPNVGVDVLVNHASNDFTIIEMNSVAVITSHVFPLEEVGIDVPEKILDYYFPNSVDNKRYTATFDYRAVLDMLASGMYDSLTIKPFHNDNKSYVLSFITEVPWAKVETVQALLQMYGFSGRISKREYHYQLFITPGSDMSIETLIDHLKTRFLFKEYLLEEQNEPITKSGIFIER